MGGSRVSYEYNGHSHCQSCGTEVCLGVGHEAMEIRPQTFSPLGVGDPFG